MKSSISTAAVIALALSAACSTSHASTPGFTITTPVPAESKNKMAYLINRETGDKVDSMLITGNELKFSGTVADPYYARILIGDKRGPSFIVEPGEITIAQDGKCTSTALNKEMNAFTERYIAVARSLDSLPSDSLKQAAVDRFNATADSTMKAHLSDPLGRIIFIDKASECRSTSALEELLKTYPQFRTLKSITDLATSLHNAEATAPGKKFTDFTVSYNGTNQN